MGYTEIHADDYALSPAASEDILKCIRAGRLDSLSVLTNMSCYEEDARRYLAERKGWQKEPLLSVHLNFMEGRCLSPASCLPHLADRNGFFRATWGQLLFWSFCPGKYQAIKKELKTEIRAQTEGFIRYFGRERVLRFDGHQHTQMLPVVYQALFEVIREEGYQTEYVRVTKEPVLPYLMRPSLWKTYRPVNLVKNLLLNILAIGMERRTRQEIGSRQPMLLWGVMLSGRMDQKRVGMLLPLMKERAGRKGRTLEILFHPGASRPEELGEEFIHEEARRFYLSRGRREEFDTVMGLQTGQGIC